MDRRIILVLAAVFASAFPSRARSQNAAPQPESSPLVSLRDVDPTILQDIRYFGDHNFVGRPIRGYRAAKCLLTRPAAEALRGVQAELREFGLSLKVYDCFRPQRAVDDFVAWAKVLSDARMKKEFYPDVAKEDLFKDGYIAAKSGHSRGSTVDLTIADLDMGSRFDFFDPASQTVSAAVGETRRAHRLLLKSVMEAHGFKNLPEEWWHYTLKDEPYPDRYFDFDIE